MFSRVCCPKYAKSCCLVNAGSLRELQQPPFARRDHLHRQGRRELQSALDVIDKEQAQRKLFTVHLSVPVNVRELPNRFERFLCESRIEHHVHHLGATCLSSRELKLVELKPVGLPLRVV